MSCVLYVRGTRNGIIRVIAYTVGIALLATNRSMLTVRAVPFRDPSFNASVSIHRMVPQYSCTEKPIQLYIRSVLLQLQYVKTLNCHDLASHLVLVLRVTFCASIYMYMHMYNGTHVHVHVHVACTCTCCMYMHMYMLWMFEQPMT